MDPIPDKVGFESVEVKRKKQGLVIQRDYVRLSHRDDASKCRFQVFYEIVRCGSMRRLRQITRLLVPYAYRFVPCSIMSSASMYCDRSFSRVASSVDHIPRPAASNRRRTTFLKASGFDFCS